MKASFYDQDPHEMLSKLTSRDDLYKIRHENKLNLEKVESQLKRIRTLLEELRK